MDCFKYKHYSHCIVFVLYTHIMNSAVYTLGIHMPHWQRDRQRCLLEIQCDYHFNRCYSEVLFTVGRLTTSRHHRRRKCFCHLTVYNYVVNLDTGRCSSSHRDYKLLYSAADDMALGNLHLSSHKSNIMIHDGAVRTDLGTKYQSMNF